MTSTRPNLMLQLNAILSRAGGYGAALHAGPANLVSNLAPGASESRIVEAVRTSSRSTSGMETPAPALRLTGGGTPSSCSQSGAAPPWDTAHEAERNCPVPSGLAPRPAGRLNARGAAPVSFPTRPPAEAACPKCRLGHSSREVPA